MSERAPNGSYGGCCLVFTLWTLVRWLVLTRVCPVSILNPRTFLGAGTRPKLTDTLAFRNAFVLCTYWRDGGRDPASAFAPGACLLSPHLGSSTVLNILWIAGFLKEPFPQSKLCFPPPSLHNSITSDCIAHWLGQCLSSLAWSSFYSMTIFRAFLGIILVHWLHSLCVYTLFPSGMCEHVGLMRNNTSINPSCFVSPCLTIPSTHIHWPSLAGPL